MTGFERGENFHILQSTKYSEVAFENLAIIIIIIFKVDRQDKSLL